MRRLAEVVLACGLAACASSGRRPDAPAWLHLRSRYDANGDGRISRAEYTRSERGFRNLDADGNGRITVADFDEEWDGVPRVEGISSLDDFVYGEGGPALGEPAPTFRLRTTAGVEIDLASFRGEKPVALVFGSFT